MLNNTPWAGLQPGGVDSRRVDAAGNWHFFWAIVAKGDPCLLLKVRELPAPLPKLPRLRSLETGFVTLPDGPAFNIRLKDHAQLEVFETLCRDVVGSAERAETEVNALIRTIGRTCRWHHLLRGGRNDLLSEEEQKGLIGELSVLDRLCDAIGPSAAVTGWRGPSGAPKDFEVHGHCIEVKARRAAAQPYVQISNEFQLSDVADHRLWLTVLAIERVTEPFGEPLDAFVSRLGWRFLSGDPAMAMDWELALAATGFREEDDYSGFRWICGQPAWYEVDHDFPRIGEPLPLGVSNVRYSLSLGSCADFEVDAEHAVNSISEGYVDD